MKAISINSQIMKDRAPEGHLKLTQPHCPVGCVEWDSSPTLTLRQQTPKVWPGILSVDLE